MKEILAERRISDEEYEIISRTLGGQPELLKILRKFFLYEITGDDPIGKSMDMWTTLDLKGLSQQDKEVAIAARQMLIQHLDGSLLGLAKIAGDKPESKEEIKKRLALDSTK